jgi:hypothetical protein
VGIVGLVVFLIEGFMPVVLIISLVFLYYVLNTVEPENIEYKVNSQGISVAGVITGWAKLRRFWFSRRFDSDLLIVETVYFPGRMELVVNRSDKEKLNKFLANYLQHEEVPPSNLDKIANFFSKKLPQNK